MAGEGFGLSLQVRNDWICTIVAIRYDRTTTSAFGSGIRYLPKRT
jgi:hypothetical protein